MGCPRFYAIILLWQSSAKMGKFDRGVPQFFCNIPLQQRNKMDKFDRDAPNLLQYHLCSRDPLKWANLIGKRPKFFVILPLYQRNVEMGKFDRGCPKFSAILPLQQSNTKMGKFDRDARNFLQYYLCSREMLK